MSLTLQQLARALDLKFEGNPGLELSGVSSIRSANAGDLCFVQYRKYLDEAIESRCSAMILPRNIQIESGDKGLLYSDHPHYSFIRAMEILRGPRAIDDGPKKHPSAQIAATARLADSVRVGALAVIGEGVEIGEQSTIDAGAIIADRAVIGANCRIHSRVSISENVRIGDRCELQAGAVIGSDGFGLVMHEQQWLKIPHLGSVVLEDDVEIGANTTIDRGALDDTLIERGCKLDNQIQVAHNVRIGAHTAIAGCVGIAGSATIGCHCKISGAAMILGHLSIADHVTITAASLVTRDIKSAGVFSSGTPLLENREWHRINVRYKSLDKLAKMIMDLNQRNI